MKVRTNDACACGSGRKQKKCCRDGSEVSAKEGCATKLTTPTTVEMSQMIALFNAGRYMELESISLRFAGRHPECGFVWKVLGATLHALDKEALPALRKATELLPDDAHALHNLGRALMGVGHYGEAVIALRRAIAIKPDYPEAHNLLGAVLHAEGQYDEAIANFRRVLSIRPSYVDAHINLGVTLTEIGQLDAALASLRTAVEIEPGNALAYGHLSSTLQFLGDFEGAVASCRRALEIKPDFVGARLNLGTILHSLGRFEEALNCYEIVLALDPHNVSARYDRSFSLFSLGRLTEGWADYDWRPQKQRERDFSVPSWPGCGLTDKAVLIWGEQGVGDEMMFASAYAEIVDRSGHCVIECASKLVPLFIRSFPGAQVVPKIDPPHPATQNGIDYECAAGSVGRWLRPTLDSFPQRRGYLTANPVRVSHWRNRLATFGPGPKIGFCWRSMLTIGRRSLHYTTLDQWAPIFNLPGVHFVNLQYDECGAELDAAAQQFGVALHAFSEVDLLNDLDEAAALTQSLDLVISAPTAAGTLAAALGVPTWTMIYGPPWDSFGTEHSPWLPSQRYFCRQNSQQWGEVIASIGQELAMYAELLSSGRG